nr:retrotransposon protein, putative, Ty1-copia subclass [Tanacetum cinerariifolium]
MEWYRNLQIMLSVEDKLPFLEQPIPAMPVPAEGQVLPLDVLNTHTAWVKASKEIEESRKTKKKKSHKAAKGNQGKAKQIWAMHLRYQGASYFVTFTDDFSRYGYVYLLKHKYEVFETFKVFQKEVENQLWKTVKSLCSGHGGEYISQEFLDHLKEHGIIAHGTPLYMPQHNVVLEKRNRTLLDMACSMMSQTTLLKSFWDYALKSVACILNMVPTKKVDKTPYKVRHEQAPKLSYLKV